MSAHQSLLPPGWPRPRGYSNGIAASGHMIFTAGIVGWDENEIFQRHDLPGQFRQVLENTLAVLAEAGAGPDHIVRMTWYITDREEYLASLSDIGAPFGTDWDPLNLAPWPTNPQPPTLSTSCA